MTYTGKYEILRDGEHVATTHSVMAWFHAHVPYSMDHAMRHEGYSFRKFADERDQAIIAERVASMDKINGPRVGDFVIFADGDTRRVSHVWEAYEYDGELRPATVQTSDGGSWHLGASGHVSFSGALHPAVDIDTLTERQGASMEASVWIFHHDNAQADNGVETRVPFRVYDCASKGI